LSPAIACICLVCVAHRSFCSSFCDFFFFDLNWVDSGGAGKEVLTSRAGFYVQQIVVWGDLTSSDLFFYRG
jgi:hypothetical protein